MFFSDCSFARAIFFSSHLKLGSSPSVHSSVCNWVAMCLASLPAGQLNIFLMLIHSIWLARNCLLWEGKLDSLALVSHLTKLHLEDFLKAMPASQSRLTQALTSWRPPPAGWININVDGSFGAATNMGGVGAVFRNEVRSYAGGFVCQISHVNNPYTVELLAARDGIFWAMQRNFQSTRLESDALQVVQGVGSLKKGSSSMDLLVDDVWESLWGLVPLKSAIFLVPPMVRLIVWPSWH